MLLKNLSYVTYIHKRDSFSFSFSLDSYTVFKFKMSFTANSKCCNSIWMSQIVSFSSFSSLHLFITKTITCIPLKIPTNNLRHPRCLETDASSVARRTTSSRKSGVAGNTYARSCKSRS